MNEHPFGDFVLGDFLAFLETPEASDTPSAADSFYADLRDNFVADVVSSFKTGITSIIRETKTETGDPLTPYSVSQASYSVEAVALGFGDRRIDMGAVRADDLKLIVPAKGLDIEPNSEDLVVIDGKYHSIVTVKPVPAAGIKTVYILQVRTKVG